MVRRTKPQHKGTVTAIELDGRYLRILQIRRGAMRTGVARWASAELDRPPTAEDRGSIQEAALVLRGLFAKNRFSRARVVIVLPRNLAITKDLRLPSHREKELREMAQNELQGQGPFVDTDLTWDVVVRERLPDGYAAVEVTQVREKDIGPFLDVLRAARLRPSGLVLSSEALMGLRSVLKGKEVEGMGVLLRASASGIDVLSCTGEGRLARRIPLVGGEKLDGRWRELDQTLSMLQGRGGEAAGDATALLTSTGAPVGVEGAQGLTRQGGVRHLSWEDLNGLAPKGIEASSLGDYALCLGAAARVLSPEPLPALLPRRMLRDRARRVRRFWQVVFGLVWVANAGLLGALARQDWTYSRRELEALQREIDRAAPIVSSLETKREVLKMTEALCRRRVAPLDFLYAIHAATPQAISLSAASLSGRRFVLRGEAPKLSRVFEYVGTLQKRPGFMTVEVQEAGMRRRGAKEVAEFSLRGTFETRKRDGKPGEKKP